MSIQSSGKAPAGRVAAIIPAAGQGKRMGGGTVKQFLPLLGKPVLAHALAAFEAAESITDVVLVVSDEWMDACRDIVARYGLAKVGAIVPGGRERQDSVYSGLRSLEPGCELVVVHDAARPLITPEVLNRAVAEARARGSVVVAVPVKDTIKVVDDQGAVLETPQRSRLWAAQTPQVFPYAVLLEAHEKARQEGFAGTDDAALVERLGRPVYVAEGSAENIKITTPEDLLLAESILGCRQAGGTPVFVGFGYDVHRLAPDRPCILGGVQIPHGRGLLGHSDADVLVHAVMDAILGAIGERDIGQHFPNTDPRYAGANSLALLRFVVGLAGQAGYRVRNLDSTVVAEEPKLAPHVEAMKENLAECLGLPPQRVAVKATTNEGLGFIGAREGIAAFAVVSVEEARPA